MGRKAGDPTADVKWKYAGARLPVDLYKRLKAVIDANAASRIGPRSFDEYINVALIEKLERDEKTAAAVERGVARRDASGGVVYNDDDTLFA